MIEVGYVPSRCASRVISSLSMPMSGRSTGSVATSPIDGRFSSVCDATWPTTSPVTSARAPARRRSLGDPHHQPPIDDDAQRRRHRQHDTLLDLAERNEEQPRPQLILRQQPHELARLLLRRARQNRIAVEVNEDARGSPAASSAMRRPASRCRPTAGRRRARSRPTGRPPAPRSLPKE